LCFNGAVDELQETSLITNCSGSPELGWSRVFSHQLLFCSLLPRGLFFFFFFFFFFFSFHLCFRLTFPNTLPPTLTLSLSLVSAPPHRSPSLAKPGSTVFPHPSSGFKMSSSYQGACWLVEQENTEQKRTVTTCRSLEDCFSEQNSNNLQTALSQTASLLLCFVSR